MDALRPAIRKLTRLSISDYYNPYTRLQWPDELPFDRYWMPPELLTPYGTDVWTELSEENRLALSRAELCNFFSITVHGERDLLANVVPLLELGAADELSEYLHHFVKEENEHQWMFATFCRKYCGTINRSVAFPGPSTPRPRDIAAFISFAQILFFEEVGVFYNQKLAADPRLPDFVRELNRVHYADESRHIAFGRLYVQSLHRTLIAKHEAATIQALHGYLEAYLCWIGESFFCPDSYKRVGMKGLATRQRLLRDDTVRIRRSEAFERSLRLIAKLRLALERGSGVDDSDL